MSKSRDIADSAATINYIDGLTSDAQSQINAKATLDGSPTFTGTVAATAFTGDGSALTGVDSLPSQTGNSGKFLTTNGSAASWDAVDVSSEITGTLPVANGGTGATTLAANNVLLGNGTSSPLAVAPSTSGNVLMSNGTTWQSVAPAGGGLEEYITKVELVSSASQIVIDNSAFSSSDYDYLILRGYNFTFDSQTYMQIRYRSGGVAKTSDYGIQLMYAYSSSGYFNAASATQSRINFINPYQQPNSNTSFVDFEIKLNHLSEYKMFYAVGHYQRGTTGGLHTQIGWHQDSTGYTFGGIEFNTSGANYNSGCILKLYGVKEQ